MEYANLLFAPLRDLARVEETMVHTKATKSLCTAFDAVGAFRRSLERAALSGSGRARKFNRSAVWRV